MPRVDFDQLPDDARLWIFTAERSLSDAEQAQLLSEVDRFVGQWGAHDVPLTAGAGAAIRPVLVRGGRPVEGGAVRLFDRRACPSDENRGAGDWDRVGQPRAGRVPAGVGHRAGATRPVRRARRGGEGGSRDDGL